MTHRHNNDLQKTLAVFLTKKFEEHGIEKKKLAEFLGVSGAYVTKITTVGDKRPSVEMLRKIINILIEKYNDIEIEHELEQLIKKHDIVKYKIEYHVYKLLEKTRDVDEFLSYLEKESQRT